MSLSLHCLFLEEQQPMLTAKFLCILRSLQTKQSTRQQFPIYLQVNFTLHTSFPHDMQSSTFLNKNLNLPISMQCTVLIYVHKSSTYNCNDGVELYTVTYLGGQLFWLLLCDSLYGCCTHTISYLSRPQQFQHLKQYVNYSLDLNMPPYDYFPFIQTWMKQWFFYTGQ